MDVRGRDRLCCQVRFGYSSVLSFHHRRKNALSQDGYVCLELSAISAFRSRDLALHLRETHCSYIPSAVTRDLLQTSANGSSALVPLVFSFFFLSPQHLNFPKRDRHMWDLLKLLTATQSGFISLWLHCLVLSGSLQCSPPVLGFG